MQLLRRNRVLEAEGCTSYHSRTCGKGVKIGPWRIRKLKQGTCHMQKGATGKD